MIIDFDRLIEALGRFLQLPMHVCPLLVRHEASRIGLPLRLKAKVWAAEIYFQEPFPAKDLLNLKLPPLDVAKTWLDRRKVVKAYHEAIDGFLASPHRKFEVTLDETARLKSVWGQFPVGGPSELPLLPVHTVLKLEHQFESHSCSDTRLRHFNFSVHQLSDLWDQAKVRREIRRVWT